MGEILSERRGRQRAFFSSYRAQEDNFLSKEGRVALHRHAERMQCVLWSALPDTHGLKHHFLLRGQSSNFVVYFIFLIELPCPCRLRHKIHVMK